MGDKSSFLRRRILHTLAIGGLSGLAGCEQFLDSETSTSTPSAASSQTPKTTPTQTVVFTDTPATSTATPTAAKTVFDGGDAAAFAAALDQTAATRGATLEIEPGTYHLSPNAPEQGAKPPHFRIDGLEDVTIAGNDATIVLNDPTRGGIEFLDATNVTIQNLNFDYEPLPFTQGTITELRNNEQIIIVELDSGYPSLDHRMFQIARVWASVHTPDGEFVRGIRQRGPHDKHFSAIEKLGDRQYALTLTGHSNSRGLRVGNKLAVVARNDHAVVKFYKCDNPTLDNVTIHASNGGAASLQLCGQPTMTESVVAPPSGSDRLIATNADGIRIINCLSDPTVEKCRFEYLEDDGIVVQQTLAPVTEIVDDHTVAIANIHPVVAAPGDVFAAMAPDGTRKGELPPVSEIALRQRRGGPDTRGKPERISFDEPIADTLTEGDLIGNLATASRGFTIRDNVLRNHRARLVRIAAGEGVVEGNTLEGAPGSALKLESESTLEPFAPKGWVTGVAIRNNQIKRPGLNYFAGSAPAGIRINHASPDDVETTGQPNRNITITNNTIRDAADVGLRLEDATSLQIENNRIASPNQLSYDGFAKVGVELNNISESSVAETRVEGLAEQLDYFGIQRESTDIQTNDNGLVVEGASSAGDIISLSPVSLLFNQTDQPGNRKLAFRCTRLSLLSDGDTIRTIGVGKDEFGIVFGNGVFSVESGGDDRGWRWFGGPSEEAELFFMQKELAEAGVLELRGIPINDDIRAEVHVDGRSTDKVHFGPREVQTHSVALE